jgi:hypothetical protein
VSPAGPALRVMATVSLPAMLAAMEDLVPQLDLPEAELACRIARASPGAAHDAEAEPYRRLAPRVRRYGLLHLGLTGGHVRVIRHRGIARLRGCVEGLEGRPS